MTNVVLDYPFLWDDLGSEMIDGVVTPMSPVGITHQRVDNGLSDILRKHFKGTSCQVFKDVFVHFSKRDVLAPDFSIVCDESLINGEVIHGTPDMVVEIISPSTSKRDRRSKKDIYEKYGVKEYWIADGRSYSVEVYLLSEGKLELNEVYAIIPQFELDVRGLEKPDYTFESKTFKGLVVDVEELFGELLPKDY